MAFNWSGANSASARKLAGVRLWILLSQVEHLEIPYVIIAHSHGGGVAFNALCTATLWANGKALPTPFLTSRSDAIFNLPTGDLDDPWIPARGDFDRCKLGFLKCWITVGTPFTKNAVKMPFLGKIALLALAGYWLAFTGGAVLLLSEVDEEPNSIFIAGAMCLLFGAPGFLLTRVTLRLGGLSRAFGEYAG